jgi:DNA (cytosine-5)-methyltransferase 1
MRTVSLFSGCLGLDLGLEAVGADTILYCENDKDCQRIIAARRPGVPVLPDVRELDEGVVQQEGLLGVDWLVGGFP